MFDFKNKKTRICFAGTLISLAILLIAFFASDNLFGNKEFSEYTRDDCSIAILPLSVIIVSGLSTLIFTLFLIIPMIRKSPALTDYIANRKFTDTELGTEFLVFDHHEFKRACCRSESQNGIWISVKEYDLKSKQWKVIEKGRYIENADDLTEVLQADYKYDTVKFYLAADYLH